jgi:1,3-beta-glucan synthase
VHCRGNQQDTERSGHKKQQSADDELGKKQQREEDWEPEVLREKGACEIFFNKYSCVKDEVWPSNPDVQWRLVALARGLGQDLPRPFRVPYVPGLTVLIPHYGEAIRLSKKELLTGQPSLLEWLKSRHLAEYTAFCDRVKISKATRWESDKCDDENWEQLRTWASMRQQTLWRTVVGMCLYHDALQCHHETQGAHIRDPDQAIPDREEPDVWDHNRYTITQWDPSRLADPDIWDPSECFTCLVTMQQYEKFDKDGKLKGFLADTNCLLNASPKCLKIAFVQSQEKGAHASSDGVHEKQSHRYFSALIDSDCPQDANGRREPCHQVELPGYPILGDGKGCNQNHAFPFARGSLVQCIDANQGGYFEQMLLLPCVLGEFRQPKAQTEQGQRPQGRSGQSPAR